MTLGDKGWQRGPAQWLPGYRMAWGSLFCNHFRVLQSVLVGELSILFLSPFPRIHEGEGWR